MPLLRQPLLLLSRSGVVKRLVTGLRVTSAVVRRYVPGETTADAAAAARVLVDDGRLVTLDFLGEDTVVADDAAATVTAYLDLLAELSKQGLASRCEVSVKLSAIGLRLPDGEAVALAHAFTIADAARNCGTTMTVDMEDHTLTDATLAIVVQLRKEHPDVGAVLQAHLRRTEEDCRALTHAGSRVRLCKGAYAEPESVAFTDRGEIDRSFVRCTRILMHGNGRPMIATHDPRMIAIASSVAAEAGRAAGTYEFQMLHGIRPEEQQRLVEQGETMRVYVPYGVEWYGYLMRRLAERPANLALFTKSLISKK